jgi:hypothetical protein
MNQSCPVCAGRLSERASGCATCPMSSGCGMMCCENCGYQTVPPRSATVDFVKKLLRRFRHDPS